MPAVETLGCATVICSDKTGTLTRNEMTVRAIVTGGARVDVGGSGYIPEGEFTVGDAGLTPHAHDAVEQTLQAAALANDAALVSTEGRWYVQGDPTEGALVVAARKFGIDEAKLARAYRELRRCKLSQGSETIRDPGGKLSPEARCARCGDQSRTRRHPKG